ncbi:hypothetical protein [Spirillospora sp. CA-294931]|uniref:hypothetical protein n=1 Tax=Spirillospora sp. CA-294931 TaxID=3240042 RepID=UPI003D944C14
MERRLSLYRVSAGGTPRQIAAGLAAPSAAADTPKPFSSGSFGIPFYAEGDK